MTDRGGVELRDYKVEEGGWKIKTGDNTKLEKKPTTN